MGTVVEMIRKTPDVANQPSLHFADDWHARMAAQIAQARAVLGLTRKELAQRVGTRQSTIARFEDPNYRGQSLAMLERIAAGLGLRLVVGLSGDENTDADDVAAAEWLRIHAPPNEEMLTWAEAAEVPLELQNDEDEERPW